ncbi:class I SAM-dependent methyltransferase [Halomonas sp. BC04]|uniref:methyltransferase domain-containing protein n=1 Tax=Halomonas sp. BC04 TaxID=1403540 RepID=UPI0003ED788E|nr:class I SAM-dependent methyltransferase [Halomonas sp. BC04]EWH02687.1 hypothetical protein Q427_07280 [Halomonas sp. BC04]
MMDIETLDLHQERLQRVAALLLGSGARRVLDLGCGTGTLLQYLLREPQFERLVGLELSGELLAQAKMRFETLSADFRSRLELVCGSYVDPPGTWPTSMPRPWSRPSSMSPQRRFPGWSAPSLPACVLACWC